MKAHNRGAEIFIMAKKDPAALEGTVEDTSHFSDEVFGFHAEPFDRQVLLARIRSFFNAVEAALAGTH